MEKLQNAIEKARQQRDGAIPPQAAPTPAAPQPSDVPMEILTEDETDALWHAVPKAKLSHRKLEKNRVISLKAGKAATPFDVLRTKIFLQMRQNNWKRLAITSPTPNSGKTTMACNLAAGLGRQKNTRAMLFELDLRRPSIANDPTRILLDEKTEETLEMLDADYKPDLMIFDLPPILISDDTRAFLDKVDCAMIVARANQTSFAQLDLTEKEVAEHTNVLGVVLNGSTYNRDVQTLDNYEY